MPIHHGAFHQKQAPTAARFFGDHCQKLLELRRDECRAFGTSIAFELDGDGGGAWTVDLAGAAVVAGARDDAKAHVAMPAADFVSLLQGKLDVQRALAMGTMQVWGELSALKALSLVFSVSEAEAA